MLSAVADEAVDNDDNNGSALDTVNPSGVNQRRRSAAPWHVLSLVAQFLGPLKMREAAPFSRESTLESTG